MTISIGRNDPCRCGSGKKYKKCCLEKDEAAKLRQAAAEAPSSSEPVPPPPSKPRPVWQGVKSDRGFRPPPPPRRGTGG